MKNGNVIMVTDPAILAQFPALSPPKTVLKDAGVDGDVYETDPGRPKAGVGDVYQCETCGTYLRPGQPHSALKPEPHQTLGALIVVEPLPVEV